MSKPLSAVDCVSPAIAQAKRQLFSPFHLKRWARLALVCLLTGEYAGGGFPGGGFNIPQSHPRHGRELLVASNFDWEKILPWLPLILVGVVLLFCLFILLIYVSSVFRFVLFDSVLYDRCVFKGCWTKWEPCGRSYFYWSLAVLLMFMAGYALLIGLPLFVAWRAGLFHHPGEHLAPLILGGIVLFFVLLIFFIAGGVIALFAKDFCVPIMALENVGVMDAWRRLLPMLGMEKMAFTGYVLMKIVLAIAASIIAGIASLLLMIILLVPLVIVGVILFIIVKAAGLTLNVGTIAILVALGGILMAGLIYLMALISTPFMVFFQSYVLHFLGSRYRALGEIVFPPAPPPPDASPFGQPPLIEPAPG